MGLLVKTPEEIIKKVKKQKIWMFKPETHLQVLHFPIKNLGVPWLPQIPMSTKQTWLIFLNCWLITYKKLCTQY